MLIVALLLAAFAAVACYDGLPGIQWTLWTTAAAAGLYHYAGPARRDVVLLLALAVFLAGGAAVTGNGGSDFAILCSCAVLLAVAMRIASGVPVDAVGAAEIALAAPAGAFETIGETWRRSGESARDGSMRASLPVLRGLALALPLVALLWILLGEADPNLSAWGSAIAAWIESLAFVPRLVFGSAVFVLVFGAYGIARRRAPRPARVPAAPAILLGATERAIIAGAVTGLLALFVALQVGYFFGDPAAAAGTGITYAEWSHRGFGELTTAAVIVTVLVVLLHTHAARGTERAERTIRALSLALAALTALVVASAFRRIVLYEQAYGFTELRLWSQAFMVGVWGALALLALEIVTALDARRLARRTAVVAAFLIGALAYWDHDAFIARRNVERFAGTPKLDVAYLARGLAVDAIPALVAMRDRLPAEQAEELMACLAGRRGDRELRPGPWYQFSWRRAAAREALATIPEGAATARGCPGY